MQEPRRPPTTASEGRVYVSAGGFVRVFDADTGLPVHVFRPVTQIGFANGLAAVGGGRSRNGSGT